MNRPIQPLLNRIAWWSLGPLLVLGIWALLSGTGVLEARTIASPARTWRAFTVLVADGSFARNVGISLARAIVGLAYGTVVGVVLALLAGAGRIGRSLVDGPMQILRALPILALQPLAILWFGIGESFKIFLIALAVSLPIYLNTLAALEGVENRYLELARSLKLSRGTLIRRVLLPGALPGFLTGLRYASAVALLVLVVGEQVNATGGIGFLMNRAIMSARTDIILVGLVTYGVLGLLSDGLLRALERRLLAWRPPASRP